MSLLAGRAASLFGELFTPLYLPGRLFMVASAYGGDGSLTRTTTEKPCLVQVDAATERMIRTEGYTTTDRALYILRAGFNGSVDSDCEIAVDAGPYAGSRWKVATPIESDPAAAYWLCRGVHLS